MQIEDAELLFDFENKEVELKLKKKKLERQSLRRTLNVGSTKTTFFLSQMRVYISQF